MEYVATFFSHFGAMQFAKKIKKLGGSCKIMPVPRQLSSSCGSCVKFTVSGEEVQALAGEEVEKIYLLSGDGFTVAIDRLEEGE